MPSAARRILAGLALVAVCLASGAARAEEPGPGSGTPVEQVIQAFDAHAGDELVSLAARVSPDRWRVADELCGKGRVDAALAFARAVPGVEGQKLGVYLKARGKRPVHAATRAALAKAEVAASAKEISAALAALEAVDSAGDEYEQTRVALARGLGLRRLGRTQEAYPVLRAAAERAEALGWLDGAAIGWSRAGFTAWVEYDADAARTAWERHRAVEALRDQLAGQVAALNNLGSLDGQLGALRSAERFFQRALALLRPLSSEGARAQTLRLQGNLAEVALRSGRFALALERIDLALGAYRKDDVSLAYAELLAIKSTIAQDMGDRDDALRLLERAERIYAMRQERASTQPSATERKIRVRRMQLRANRGLILQAAGRFKAARALLKGARTAFAAAGAVPDEASALNNVGLIEFALGRRAESRRLLRQAIERAETVQARLEVANAKQDLAVVLTAERRFEEAMTLQVAALGDAKRVGSVKLIAEGHMGLARIWMGLGKPRRALASAHLAVDALLEVLRGLASAQGPHARAQHAMAIQIGVEAALAEHDVDEAWWFIERSRATTLLEELQGREEIRDSLLPKDLLVEERKTAREVAAARRLYDRGRRARNLARMRQFKAALDAALRRRRALTARVLQTSRRAAALLYAHVDERVEFLSRLRPGDVFVAYAFTRRGVVAIVMDHTDARLVDLGSRAALETSLASVTWDDAAEVVDEKKRAALREALLGRLALPKETKRIILSPAGALFAVPFGALLPEKSMTIVPSATTYGILLDEAQAEGTGVLGVGAADYTGRPSSLVPLDGSRTEVEAVASRSLLGPHANEIELRKELARAHEWRALHMAVHGTFDAVHPWRGALALTRSDDDADDGYLTALELLRMRVPAQLAVLSACVTGKGRAALTGGLSGLPRAFLIAGVPRVVVSLWNVDDEATLALMKQFHALWNPKDPNVPRLSAAEALRRAQAFVRTNAKHPKWAHPYYWAAWVLWGVPD